MIKNENFISIQGFMINELHLKGNELLIYAIIYGFSQTENQVYSGSLSYLAEWTSSTKQGVIKNLKSLLDKKYIEKIEKEINNVKFCEYRVTKFNGIKQSLMGGIKQSLPNNIDIYNIDNNNYSNYSYLFNKDLNKDINSSNEYKIPYGEFKNVYLTEKEYNILKNKFKDYKNKIEYLSAYLESTGKEFQSHYGTIILFDLRDKEKQTNNKNEEEKPRLKRVGNGGFQIC